MHWFARTRLTLTGVALLTLVATVLIPAAARIAAAAPVGSITEYPVPTAYSDPFGITSGPDGALWFTEENTNQIGRITTTGNFIEYPIPSPYSLPYSITAGPDGALWFVETGSGPESTPNPGKIGRITTTGSFTEYPLPTAFSGPTAITTGPDGALWFVESSLNANKIGRITTTGQFTEYPIPTPNSDPTDITSGPDGALWFVEANAGKIGRITTTGSFTEYPLPAQGGPTYPNGITTGPDGALWFTASDYADTPYIGRITISGQITQYLVPSSGALSASPNFITTGPDGALWFTDTGYGNEIGRITTAGQITQYPLPTYQSHPWRITTGPDGSLWFTEAANNMIGRITASAPPAPTYRLSFIPGTQTATIGGQGLVTATLVDAATGAPVANATLSLRVESGPNAGLSGTCVPSSCITDSNGQVNWGYFGTAMGIDTVQVWLDGNGNGTPDPGEPQAIAVVIWDPPTTLQQSPNWAGYVLHNPPALQPVSAQITVPTLPATCPTTGYSSFWVGFGGASKKDTFLPQVGFEADCLAGHHHAACSGTTSGPNYYMWWEINPTTGQHAICTLPLAPGDRVDLIVQPGATQVTMTAFITSADGSVGPVKWSQTFPVKKPTYSTMECIAEDTLKGNGPAPFATFSPTEFDNCSAILDYRAASTLDRLNIYAVVKHHYAAEEAATGPLVWQAPQGTQVSFTVTRVNG